MTICDDTMRKVFECMFEVANRWTVVLTKVLTKGEICKQKRRRVCEAPDKVLRTVNLSDRGRIECKLRQR